MVVLAELVYVLAFHLGTLDLSVVDHRLLEDDFTFGLACFGRECSAVEGVLVLKVEVLLVLEHTLESVVLFLLALVRVQNLGTIVLTNHTDIGYLIFFAFPGNEVILDDGRACRGRAELPDGILLEKSVILLLLLFVEVFALLRRLFAGFQE